MNAVAQYKNKNEPAEQVMKPWRRLARPDDEPDWQPVLKTRWHLMKTDETEGRLMKTDEYLMNAAAPDEQPDEQLMKTWWRLQSLDDQPDRQNGKLMKKCWTPDENWWELMKPDGNL